MLDNPTVNLAARSLVLLQRLTEPKPAARPHGPSIFSYCHAVVLHSGVFFLPAGSEPGFDRGTRLAACRPRAYMHLHTNT